MSTLAVNAITDANGGNTATINSMTPTADSLQGFRNRIINGDMRIDQRNAGASINNTTSGPISVDRWVIYGTADTKYSAQRSTTAPSGFVNSLLLTSLAATSVGVSDRYVIWQKIEGNNISDFAWGSASAKTISVSFWARSSITGTYGGCIVNSAGNRSYPFTYSISAANTFEYKTITIAGDTSGTWLTDNGIGLYLQLAFGAGSTFSGTAGAWAGANYSSATGATNWISTSGATFYITGVQLEVGSVATPFERRPYGMELSLCQRYYYRLKATGANYPFGIAQCYGTTSAGALIPYPVTMRTAPSALEQSGTAGDYRLYTASGSTQTCSAVPAYAGILTTTAYGAVNFTVTANIVAGDATAPHAVNSSAYLGWSAEL
jgi:hypothetical protein